MNSFNISKLNQKAIKPIQLLPHKQTIDQQHLIKKPLIRHGSTSTISTYSSLNSTIASVNSLMTSDNTTNLFKTVNSTFNSVAHSVHPTGVENKVIKLKQESSVLIKPLAPLKTPLKKPVSAACQIKAVNKTPVSKAANKQVVAGFKTPLKKVENYTIDDLNSGDETDDEDMPRKPIPEWAQWHLIKAKVVEQQKSCINFTKLFKSASQDINLEEIFIIQRMRFTQRSSSACWDSPPVWKTGLNQEAT